MFDGQVKRGRRSHESDVEEQNRQKSERECQAVIEHSFVLQIFDFSRFAPRFQAGRAEMMAVQHAITQGAQETAAVIAWLDGFFLRMIKTTGLAFLDDRLPSA